MKIFDPKIFLLILIFLAFAGAAGISCYSGGSIWGVHETPVPTFYDGYSFTNYACVKFCSRCSTSSGCTADQISSGGLITVFEAFPSTSTVGGITTETIQLPQFASAFINLVVCTTNNCNSPPLSCVIGQGL